MVPNVASTNSPAANAAAAAAAAAAANQRRDTSYIESLVPSLPYAEFGSVIGSSGLDGGDAMTATGNLPAQDIKPSSSTTGADSEPLGNRQWAEMMMQEFDFTLLDPSFAAAHGITGPSAPTGSRPSSEPREAHDLLNEAAERNRRLTDSAERNPDDQFEADDIFENLFGRDVTAGWFEPTDLPDAARDKLLRLYFERERTYALQMDQTRFYARLAKSKAERPHPCLLFGMVSPAKGHWWTLAILG
jgi:hypothetical protein